MLCMCWIHYALICLLVLIQHGDAKTHQTQKRQARRDEKAGSKRQMALVFMELEKEEYHAQVQQAKDYIKHCSESLKISNEEAAKRAKAFLACMNATEVNLTAVQALMDESKTSSESQQKGRLLFNPFKKTLSTSSTAVSGTTPKPSTQSDLDINFASFSSPQQSSANLEMSEEEKLLASMQTLIAANELKSNGTLVGGEEEENEVDSGEDSEEEYDDDLLEEDEQQAEQEEQEEHEQEKQEEEEGQEEQEEPSHVKQATLGAGQQIGTKTLTTTVPRMRRTTTKAYIVPGCAMKRGEQCDCGDDCECDNCPMHPKYVQKGREEEMETLPKTVSTTKLQYSSVPKVDKDLLPWGAGTQIFSTTQGPGRQTWGVGMIPTTLPITQPKSSSQGAGRSTWGVGSRTLPKAVPTTLPPSSSHGAGKMTWGAGLTTMQGFSSKAVTEQTEGIQQQYDLEEEHEEQEEQNEQEEQEEQEEKPIWGAGGQFWGAPAQKLPFRTTLQQPSSQTFSQPHSAWGAKKADSGREAGPAGGGHVSQFRRSFKDRRQI